MWVIRTKGQTPYYYQGVGGWTKNLDHARVFSAQEEAEALMGQSVSLTDRKHWAWDDCETVGVYTDDPLYSPFPGGELFPGATDPKRGHLSEEQKIRIETLVRNRTLQGY